MTKTSVEMPAEDHDKPSLDAKEKVRLIAFYLPQYHPIPENDEWWGKGFTEWTNVVKAKPLFPGHYQPHLPADLGFYDLRLPEARQAQADLARAYGIGGFCYYHYWFNGRRLLERPFNDVLKSDEPDFPFCLCWANENWTRTWDGEDRQVLVNQHYSAEDDRTHIRSLMPAFQDDRYIKINGKPLFLVYRINSLPNPVQTAEIWREEAERAGLPGLYLCTVMSIDKAHVDPHSLDFDAAIDFQPDWNNVPTLVRPFIEKIKRRIVSDNPYYVHRVWNYGELVENMLGRPAPKYKVIPGVTPAWDNSSRRKEDALIVTGSTPEIYRSWLASALTQAEKSLVGEERCVFINAWNEWAEGNHLEPDQKWGRAYLEATYNALQDYMLLP